MLPKQARSSEFLRGLTPKAERVRGCTKAESADQKASEEAAGIPSEHIDS